MVEGKTFEFAPDSSLEGNYIDEDDDGDETPSGSAGNLHKTKRNQSFVEVEVLEEDDDTSLELDGFTEDIDSSTVEESGLPLPDLGGADNVELSNDDTNEMPDAEEPDDNPPACETQLESAAEDNSDAEGDADGEDEELDEEDLF